MTQKNYAVSTDAPTRRQQMKAARPTYPRRGQGLGDTPLRNVRIEDKIWQEAKAACAVLGTNPSEVMREALLAAIRKANKQTGARQPERVNTQ